MMTRMISVMKMRQRYIGIASTILASTFVLTLLINTVGLGIIDSSRDLTHLEGLHGVRRIRSFNEDYQYEDKNRDKVNLKVKHVVQSMDEDYTVRYSGAVQSVGANDNILGRFLTGSDSRVNEVMVNKSHLTKVRDGNGKLILKAFGVEGEKQDFVQLHSKLAIMYQDFHHPKEVPLDKFSMNVTKSMLVSPNRILKDTRPIECKEQTFDRILGKRVSQFFQLCFQASSTAPLDGCGLRSNSSSSSSGSSLGTSPLTGPHPYSSNNSTKAKGFLNLDEIKEK